MRSLTLVRAWIVALALSPVLVSAAAAQTVTIGTSPTTSPYPWDVSNQGTGQGVFQSQIGETFKAPDAVSTQLTSFTFWATDYYASQYHLTSAKLFLSILEWSGSSAVGSALFTSEAITPTSSAVEGTPFTFNMDVPLDPTRTYVAFVGVAGPPAAPGQQIFGAAATCNFCPTGGAYAGGQLVQRFTTLDPATGRLRTLDDHPEYQMIDGSDMLFSATFDAPVTATPEPASVVLLATGMAGVGGWARRRKASARP